MPKQKRSDRPFIDARSMSLEDWLSKVYVPDDRRAYLIEDYCFPTQQLRDEYLASVAQRSDRDVKTLLRCFLIPSGSLGHDKSIIEGLLALPAPKFEEMLQSFEFLRRIFSKHPWEGITWVLDLLPDNPREAIRAISSYFSAHIMFLPDGRWTGLDDAREVIRAKYLHAAHTPESLMTLSPREFEILITECFSQLGYQASLGAGTKDGGVDVIAYKNRDSGGETILIQCKLYEDTVGVSVARELYGVVESRKATKGIVITTSRFSSDAETFAIEAKRLELVDFAKLDRLLNSAFGAQWPSRLDIFLDRRRPGLTKSSTPTHSEERTP